MTVAVAKGHANGADGEARPDEETTKLQVIILGSGGGPSEDNTTSLLVRSIGSGWKRGSVLSVDAGTHLSTLTRMLAEEAVPSSNAEDTYRIAKGPFKGFPLPHKTAAANAAHLTTTLIDTYLITHPHLDHISAFVINTVVPNSRPKRLAGLPSTIEAFKAHIFNNVIWPNLSDENNGAGLVTYMRLVEGGSPALGDGDARGYFEICEGLGVKILGVSHGHCVENHNHRGSASQLSLDPGHESPRVISRRTASPHRRGSRQYSSDIMQGVVAPQMCVVESSAYFIRDVESAREVLIFGDVEPDSISLSPRNRIIWQEAAPKIISGNLRAVFIECSYDDSQSEDTLFGHLAPRYLIAELKTLAAEVTTARTNQKGEAAGGRTDSRKRKRGNTLPSTAASPRRKSPRSNGTGASKWGSPAKAAAGTTTPRRTRGAPYRATSAEVGDGGGELAVSHRKGTAWSPETHGAVEMAPGEKQNPDGIVAEQEVITGPLHGLQVVVIHVKEKLDDGPEQGGVILQQLIDHEASAQLGCQFVISRSGMAVYV